MVTLKDGRWLKTPGWIVKNDGVAAKVLVFVFPDVVADTASKLFPVGVNTEQKKGGGVSEKTVAKSSQGDKLSQETLKQAVESGEVSLKLNVVADTASKLFPVGVNNVDIFTFKFA